MIYQPAEDSYLLSKVLKEQLPVILKKNSDLTFLEIGAGSGIQLQTTLNAGVKKENIFACDLNNEAVEHCRKLGFNCIKSNLFEKIKGKFDVMVFNPPYLPEDKSEPISSKISTTGGKNGGEIINKFLSIAKVHLNNQGKIFLLISSLTKGIDLSGYKKKLLGKRKLFFEELYCWELK